MYRAKLPVKYAQKTGIPPVDEVTLMYYNMSSVQDMKTYNSILDNTEGEKYIKGAIEYPLHINIACHYSVGAYYSKMVLCQLY